MGDGVVFVSAALISYYYHVCLITLRLRVHIKDGGGGRAAQKSARHTHKVNHTNSATKPIATEHKMYI